MRSDQDVRELPDGPGRARRGARARFRVGLLPVLGLASLWLLLGAGCGGPEGASPQTASAPAPSGQRTPAEEAASFRVAPGFRVALVAAEPLVSDPVAIAWDDAGLLYAVERHPAPAARGRGSARGRVVVLEDVDGDGAMDRSDVFVEGLAQPHALAVRPEGVLVATASALWLCRDTDGDRACDERRAVARGEAGHDVPEGASLVTGLDGWTWDGVSGRRFRFAGGELEEAPAGFRGPRALAFDDAGRLYASDAQRLLFVELLPLPYLMRHPATDPRLAPQPGAAVPLAAQAEAEPQAAGAFAIDRDDRLGQALRGDAFVPRPGLGAVERTRVERDGVMLHGELARYADAGPGAFLTSEDDRFRPVSAAIGPDGALYVVDRYGASAAAPERGVSAPGRIWRVAREGRRARRELPDLVGARPEALVALLDHPSGWVRDHAQRRLVRGRDPAVAARLRGGAGLGPRGRLHALHALAGMGRFDRVDFETALSDGAPRVRAAALRLAEPWLRGGDPGVLAMALARAGDADPRVRLQLLLTLGEVPAAARPLDAMLALAEAGVPAEPFRTAFASGLAGRELDALVLAAAPPARASLVAAAASAALVGAVASGPDAAALAALLDAVAALPAGADEAGGSRRAALRGLAAVAERPGFTPVALAERPALFAPAALRPDAPGADELARAGRAFTWPGDRSGAADPVPTQGQTRRARDERPGVE